MDVHCQPKQNACHAHVQLVNGQQCYQMNKKQNLNNMSKPLKLIKVPVTQLMQILHQLYEDGADFIDIEGQHRPNGSNDVIKVTVRPEYYETDADDDSQEKTDSEFLVTEVPYEPPSDEINPLSEEDINDLI